VVLQWWAVFGRSTCFLSEGKDKKKNRSAVENLEAARGDWAVLGSFTSFRMTTLKNTPAKAFQQKHSNKNAPTRTYKLRQGIDRSCRVNSGYS
jgi:hypothetical protein